MKISMEKSRFLCLAYQAQAGGATDRGHLDAVEAKLQRLLGELEASQRSREELTHRKAQARSQIEALTSQMASLEDMMVVQETELISAGTTRMWPSRGVITSKLSAKNYAPLVVVSPLLSCVASLFCRCVWS
jgi:hypothetical protein